MEKNIAIGTLAMGTGTKNSADQNVAIGYKSLEDVTTGDSNVCVGNYTGDDITSGGNNTAVGYAALDSMTTGSGNTAIGDGSMQSITTNTILGAVAVGQYAFKGAAGTTTGANYTVAIGTNALYALTTGAENVALGFMSAYTLTT